MSDQLSQPDLFYTHKINPVKRGGRLFIVKLCSIGKVHIFNLYILYFNKIADEYLSATILFVLSQTFSPSSLKIYLLYWGKEGEEQLSL